eukprot:365627-Chlamydomonas_euryale.AAC.2
MQHHALPGAPPPSPPEKPSCSPDEHAARGVVHGSDRRHGERPDQDANLGKGVRHRQDRAAARRQTGTAVRMAHNKFERQLTL